MIMLPAALFINISCDVLSYWRYDVTILLALIMVRMRMRVSRRRRRRSRGEGGGGRGRGEGGERAIIIPMLTMTMWPPLAAVWFNGVPCFSAPFMIVWKNYCQPAIVH